MKYNIKEFNRAVDYYKKNIKKIKDKNILVILNHDNKKAFLSIAPFSRAAHELKKEVCVIDKESNSLSVLLKTYGLFGMRAKKSKETKILNEFIKTASKKIGNEFIDIFKIPFIFETKENFSGTNLKLNYMADWFGDYKKRKLLKTCKLIWKEVYNLKKNETANIGFELIPAKKDMGLPLEDYLDSYSIILAMKESCYSKKRVGAVTSRFSQLEKLMPVSDLSATLFGCELSKSINEPIFKIFKKFSKIIKAGKLKPANLSFSIRGKGYAGKHIFGERIGYPSPDRKTRWNSPAAMVYKLDWYPQTRVDKRLPKSRLGFTETLPIDIFIKTCDIDWEKLRKRTRKIQKIMEKCSKIIVEGEKINNNQTKLTVNLVGKKHRWVRADAGYETKHKIHKEYFKRTGLKAGAMSNIPAGEIFVTPEYLEGTFVGDVVISIDQSYMLCEKEPIVAEANKKGYKVIKGPKDILKKFNKKKEEAWKLLLEQEKHKSLPKRIIKLKKKNFNKIGEFAINTNPKAELCNYLIVNEKIANMIHIAFGSGFEPDRPTEYHVDVVINAPRQKLDIYGLKGKEKLWIFKKGKFVV